MNDQKPHLSKTQDYFIIVLKQLLKQGFITINVYIYCNKCVHLLDYLNLLFMSP